MMKKILIVMFCFLCLGCSKQVKKIEKPKKEETKQVVEEKKIPMSFYKLKTEGSLEKVSVVENSNYELFQDVLFLQVFPSNEDSIKLKDNFSLDFYNTWKEYNKDNLYKIGFSISFTNSARENISYTIKDPNSAMKQYEYLLIYLYDDYANRSEGWYSHIEQKDYNNDTLFTSIKLTSNEKYGDIISDIEVSVFTYKNNDDFDSNGNYIGKDKETVKLKNIDV